MAAALLLLVAQSAAELAGPLLVAYAIDTGIPAAVAGDATPLVWAIGGLRGPAAASAGFRAGFLLLTGRIGQDVLLDLRRRVFAHGQRLSLDFHERYTSGRFISRLTSDVDALNDLLEKGLDGFGGAVLSLVGISVLLVWLDPVLAVIVLAGFVPLLLLTRWFQRRSRATYRRTRVTVARLIVQFVESMNGIRAVQAYRREERNDAIMDGLGAAYRDANAETIRTVAWYVGALRGVGNLTLALVLAVGGLRVAGGALELGALTAFLLYLRRFYDPLDELAQFFNAYQSAAAALEKIAAVLDTPPDVPEPAAPVALPVAGARGAAVRGGAVRLPVRPAAHRAARAVADRAGGQTVALVGATGAGKSTLAKLAARFYDPTDGAVTAGRRRPARRRRRRAAPRARDGHAGGVPVLRVGRRQHRAGAAGRVARRGRRGRGGGGGARRSSRRCPTGSTPTCASAAGGCRRASGSSSRSPGWCWPTRRWCCSTRPRRRWTCRASGRCRRRWRRCWPTARR